MVHFEWAVVDRDSSVRVDGSVHAEAKDIFGGLIRGFDSKFSEKRFSFF